MISCRKIVPFDRTVFLHCIDALLVVLFVAQVLTFLGIGMEDALICYRYARNWARGDGLVYNPGEYVEGVSNLPWTFALAVLHWIGLPLNAAVYVLIVACSTAFFLVFRRASIRILSHSPWLARLPLLMIVCFTAMPASFGNGLEGSAVALALALAVLGVASRNVWILIFGMAFLATIRPEGIVYVCVIAVWLILAARQQKVSRHHVIMCLTAVGLVVGLLTAFRLAYYGDYIPNTVRAKSAPFGEFPYVTTARHYLMGYWDHLGWPIVFFSLFGTACNRHGRALAVLLLTLVGFNAAVVFQHGGDWMINFRLLTPFFPLITLLVAMALNVLIPYSRPIATLCAVICCFSAVRMIDASEIARLTESLRWIKVRALQDPADPKGYIDDHLSVADFRRPDDKVLVESGGGPAYVLDRVYVLEMNALTSRSVVAASNPNAYQRAATGTVDWKALFDEQPTYILFNLASTFYYVNQIANLNEVRDCLSRYIVVQNLPLGPVPPMFNLMLVRDDRASLTKFLIDYGAFAPATDFIDQRYASDYILTLQETQPGHYRDDLLQSTWQQESWRLGNGMTIASQWHDWAGNPRLSSMIPLEPGVTRCSKTLPDDAPVVLLIGVDGHRDPGFNLRAVCRQSNGDLHSLGQWASKDVREGTLHTRFIGLAIAKWSPGACLQLEFNSDGPGNIFVAAHRWCHAPLPALPPPIENPLDTQK